MTIKQRSDLPADPRPASTVILIREHDSTFQVYLLKRSSGSVSFPANYVFPGGTVDLDDRDVAVWKTHVDMGSEEIERRFGDGLSVADALAHGVAAIRETFEEAGLLLASGVERVDGGLDEILKWRQEEKPKKGWLRSWATSGAQTLSLSRLTRWAHWITPGALRPRFDTRFFVAFVPPDQKCAPDVLEMTRGLWVTPEEGLYGNLHGEIPLSPPTIVTLQELLAYASAEGMKKDIKDRPWGETRRPRLFKLPEMGAILLEPWDPMFDQQIEVDVRELEASVLPLGEPFSRLWAHGGLCRPVAVTGRALGNWIE